ncbi:MAG TPA: hypothetical protein VLU24_07125 [Mycobacterium sp.]|nr:hypothetical protein [Mycobacterium sp.]
MKKLLAVAGGSVALASMGFLTAGHASSDNNGVADVSGLPYAQAVKILRSQGLKGVFGGSVGSDVPQAQCIVDSEKFLRNGRVSLMLNCTRAAQPAPSAADPNAPVVGSNGVTTVKATPVAPPPTELGPPPAPLMPEGG